MILETIYTLFLVTNNAEVHTSRHSTLNECLEARSLAVFGKTIEQKKVDDTAEKKDELARQAKFDAEHPWREPETPREKEEVSRGYGHTTCGKDCSVTEVRNGKIRTYSSNLGLVNFGAFPNNSGIRTSVCVIVPEQHP